MRHLSCVKLQLLLLLPLLLLCNTFYAQQRSHISGRVTSGNLGVPDVLVVNNSAQTETRTDERGNFTLKMQVGDLLILTDRKIQTKKVRYTPDLIKNNILLLEVVLTAEELEEVVINRSTITSESLGLPAGKEHTVAERRLATAGDFKPIHLLGLLAGSLQVDPIINAINGRTKRLKKELKTEQREQLLEKVWQHYNRQEFVEQYHIPKDYTVGFAYFVIEDAAFTDALLAKNKAHADVQLAALSVEFLDALAYEK